MLVLNDRSCTGLGSSRHWQISVCELAKERNLLSGLEPWVAEQAQIFEKM